MATSKAPISVRNAISRWDGQSVDDLRVLYSKACLNENFVKEIIEIIKDPIEDKYEEAATWLLKCHLENSNKKESKTKSSSLTNKQVNAIYASFASFRSWQARLHVLQCIQHIGIPLSNKKEVEAFLRDCLNSENKFVRAWAYSGFYELARLFHEYQAEATQFFNLALKDEPASVKARVRNILKAGF